MTFGWVRMRVNRFHCESVCVYGKKITMVLLCKLFALDKVSSVYFQAASRSSHETEGIPLMSSVIFQREIASLGCF